MGAGGAGARRGNTGEAATGGYSGSWGVKRVRVKKGEQVAVAIGAAGEIAAAQLPGGNGGNTTITVQGVSYVAYGGPGGLWQASGAIVPPAGPKPSANWDFGAASVRPGALVQAVTGGAGVDIMARGNDATTSTSSNGSGGGGTGGPSVGLRGGGAMPDGSDSLGTIQSSQVGGYVDASDGSWGISFYGGGGGASGGYRGGNGGGGGGNTGSTGGGGGQGGGGGSSSAAAGVGGSGGIGAGGGAGTASSGRGGQGYAVLNFTADKGV